MDSLTSIRRLFWASDAVDMLSEHYFTLNLKTGIKRIIYSSESIETEYPKRHEQVLTDVILANAGIYCLDQSPTVSTLSQVLDLEY